MSEADTKYNIRVYQGATYSQTFQFLDGNGNPLDLTNYTPNAELRVAYTDTTASAAFTSSVIAPPTSGSIALSLHPSSSACLTQRAYVYDLTLTFASTVIRPLEGKVVVSPSVTR